MSERRVSVAALAVLALVVVLAAPAHARGPGAVSLTASDRAVVFGDRVTLTASIQPPVAGESVAIVDASGATLAAGITEAAGTFAATVKPVANLVVHASWQGVDSARVSVGLRPVMKLGRGPIRLFDTLAVRGAFHPARPGAPVTVELQHRGSVVATTHPKLTGAGRFTTAFKIVDAGSYRVRAVLDAPDLLPGRASTASSVAPLPPDLGIGARGPSVGALEHRLVELHYHLAGVDDVFDYRTADAVLAFRKVQGLPRISVVDGAAWRALGDPKVFVPRDHADGVHIEVDQTRQVLAVVEDGNVEAMIHVSTGKPSTPTHDGSFHIYSKLAGFSPKHLYYPSFFDGERAIHGWTDVPTYAASHGCVRIPYWVTRWMFGQDPIGTPVLIYH